MRTEVRYRMDYIQGMNHDLYRNMSVWDLSHNSYIYMILGCPRRTTLR